MTLPLAAGPGVVDAIGTVIHGARKVDVDGEVDDFWVAFGGGVIAATGTGASWREAARGDASVVDAGGSYLTPGFIDLHCHGAGGFAFDDGAYAIEQALAAHRAHGTTRAVVSLVANPVDELVASLETVADVAATDPLVLGAHLEGPFLAPSRKGAHNPAFLIDPSPAAVERFLAAGHEVLRQVTLAPELPNALETIELLVSAGVEVAVGHTEATADQARAAFDVGARLLTHAFNAMPGIGHRAPGPVVAALQDERVTLELIVDGVHVHPDVARLAFGEASGRIALITDAMAAAAGADGPYRLGTLEVIVAGGVALLVEPDGSTGAIAGSTLTLDAAVRGAIGLVGLSAVEAVAAATSVPAAALGLGHRLGRVAPGFAADVVLLDRDWRVRSVWGAGTKLA